VRRFALAAAALLCIGATEPGADAAVRWLRANAAAVATVNPDVAGRDLAPLSAIAGDARIVAFGEATHGAREFFQFKDRAFRHLARNDGFRGFAIEANFAAVEAIDRWVNGGDGDPEALVGGMGFWTWDTEEVLSLVRWMREQNLRHGARLRMFGIDIQHAAPNIAIALDYFAAVDPDWPADRAAFDAYVAAATNQSAGYRFTAAMTPEQGRALRLAAERLVSRLETQRDAYVARTSAEAHAAALSAATAAAWYFVMEGPNADRRFWNFRSGYDIRDRAMADLAILAQRRLGDDGRLFVWAHNAHVTNTPFEDSRMTMGQFLRRDIGGDYVAVGFAFDRGTFQAMPPADPARADAPRRLTEMAVGPAPADHSEAVLRRAGPPIWIADLRRVPPGTPACAWFATPRPLRWTGALYSVELMAKHRPISLAGQFDALVFVAETRRARPLPATRARFDIAKDW